MSTSDSRGFKFTYLKSLHEIRFPSDKYYRVLVTLLDYADSDGTNARPGNERLAEDCQCNVHHVRKKILPWLQSRGFIILTRQGRHRVGASEWRFPPTAPRSTAGHPDNRLHDDHSRASGHLSAGSQPGLQGPAHQIITKTAGCGPGVYGVGTEEDPWVTPGSPTAPGSGSGLAVGDDPAASDGRPVVGTAESSALLSKANEDPWEHA